MSIALSVSVKYRVGDNVGLPQIRAVGQVLDRRGLLPGADYDGAGRYLVEFTGVPEELHRALVASPMLCRCRAHDRLYAKMSRRKFDLQRDFPALSLEAEANCESKHLPEQEKSRIWFASRELVNCTGKRRLPLGATGGPRPMPYFDLAPAGTWDPTSGPR